jgi:glycosyltransferase involved in cell wall biosynthesis
LEKIVYSEFHSKNVIAVSNKTKNEIYKFYKRRESDIKVIYNEIDFNRFNTDRKDRERKSIKGKLNIPDSHKILLFVGQFAMKNLKTLLHSLSLLKQSEFTLLVAGEVKDRYFIDLAKEFNVDDNIRWLGKVINIEKYYKAADLFVFPTPYDSCARVIGEAIATKLPIICSAPEYCGISELLSDENSALFINDPLDAQEIANKIDIALQDDNLRKKLAENAYKLVAVHTPKRNAEEVLEAYKNVIEKKKKSKVLIIGHHFVTKNNHRRIEELVRKCPDMEISLLSPYWWHEESRKVYLEKEYSPDYAIYKGRSVFTNHVALSFYLCSIFKLLRRIKPDIIDIYEEPWSLTTLQVLLYKKIFLRKSKVMFYSAQNINKKYPFPFNLIERFTFNNADYAYPCSKGAEEVLRAKGYKGQIKVVPLGLDEAEAASSKSEVFTIGFVGRLVEEKGILDLINALNQINRDYKLLIIGDGPLRERLKRVIKFRSMEKKVELVGAVAREEMPSLYARMDLLVAPSKTTARWKEQFGRMLAEAMMYGVAVIGSDSGSIPEVMAGCGVVFREGNVSKLKESIFNLMNDEKARNEIIKRGREYALSHYTWDRTTEMIKDIYYELAK